MRRLAAIFTVLTLAFAPAATWAQPVAAPAAPGAHTVQFEFLQDRQILFPVTINGRPAEAWLDSGASATVVDAAFAREIGLVLGESIPARGVAGQVQGVRLASATVRVGDVAVPVRRVAVMDLSAVASVVPRPVEVILGREAFQNAVVEIDFARQEIAFTPREAFRPPRGRPIPLKSSGSLKSFPVRIGGVRAEAILDLGNSGALLLDSGFVEKKRLLKGRRTSTQLSVGADGPRESVIATFDNVRVGGVRFDGVSGVATQGLISQAPANVGLEILSRFRMTIDFAGGRMWLQPIAGAAEQPFRKNRAGVSVALGPDYLRVSHVAPGGPAEAAGWRVGDRIVAVDGRPVGQAFVGPETTRWIYGPAGRVVQLTMAGGERRALRLADYF